MSVLYIVLVTVLGVALGWHARGRNIDMDTRSELEAVKAARDRYAFDSADWYRSYLAVADERDALRAELEQYRSEA